MFYKLLEISGYRANFYDFEYLKVNKEIGIKNVEPQQKYALTELQ